MPLLPPPAIAIAVALLAAVAFIFSRRLWKRGLEPEALAGCGEGSGCDAVLASRWSRWGAVPVAALATGLYLGLWVCAATVALPAGAVPIRAWVADKLLVPMVLIAAGAALWFLILQAVVIRRWCAYCTTVHVLGLTSAVVLFWSGGPPGPSAATAVTLVACLIVGQLTLVPRRYALRQMEDAPLVAAAGGGAEPAAGRSPVANRVVRLLAGKVVVTSDGRWPALGSADAKVLIAVLFDYTCPACRRVHGQLAEAVELLAPDLGVLTVPVPQSPACNPSAHAEVDRDACAFARLGLWVWERAPSAYQSFVHWLLGVDPPSLAAAAERARGMAGADGFDPGAAHAGFDRAIADGVALYRAAGTGKVPTVLLPRAVVTGEVPSTAEMIRILRRELDLPVRQQPAPAMTPSGWQGLNSADGGRP